MLYEKELERRWDWLVLHGIATDNEIQLVTEINGWNYETIDDIVYARTGYRTFEQLREDTEDLEAYVENYEE